jgi:hypothetical protein
MRLEPMEYLRDGLPFPTTGDRFASPETIQNPPRIFEIGDSTLRLLIICNEHMRVRPPTQPSRQRAEAAVEFATWAASIFDGARSGRYHQRLNKQNLHALWIARYNHALSDGGAPSEELLPEVLHFALELSDP